VSPAVHPILSAFKETLGGPARCKRVAYALRRSIRQAGTHAALVELADTRIKRERQMKEIERILGPYRHKTGQLKGRAYLQIHYCDGSKGTMLYSRYKMEEHLGRRLNKNETVDHIDEDVTNDDLSNLRVVSRSENAKMWAANNRDIDYTTFICPECGEEAEKETRYVKHNRKQGKAGPFCGRSCAGKYSARG